jgi:DNA-binding transcriptional ArsR family regulator
MPVGRQVGDSWVIVHLLVYNCQELDRSFLALSHPIRRAIVQRLVTGPATVGQASGGLGVSKPAVTKHVRVLEEAGVISRAVRGRTHVLRLEPSPLREASEWLELHRSLWAAKFAAVEEHLADSDDEQEVLE